MPTQVERIRAVEVEVKNINERLDRIDTRIGELQDHHHSNGRSRKSEAAFVVGVATVVVAIIEGIRLLAGG